MYYELIDKIRSSLLLILEKIYEYFLIKNTGQKYSGRTIFLCKLSKSGQ